MMRQHLPDSSIDLTVTSPPYDDLREYNGYTFEFEAIAAELWRVTKPGGYDYQMGQLWQHKIKQMDQQLSYQENTQLLVGSA